jgi:hypothetical protein
MHIFLFSLLVELSNRVKNAREDEDAWLVECMVVYYGFVLDVRSPIMYKRVIPSTGC